MEKEIATLAEFNRRTENLLSSPLWNKVLAGDLKCSFSWRAAEPIVIESPGFDSTELEAFILTVRMLVQNNERLSITNVGNIYESLPVSEDRKHEVRESRRKLNDFLDSHMMFTWTGGVDTYRQHFDTVLYGELAHSNKEKAELFSRWVNDDFIKPHVWTLFLMCLQNIVASASYVRVVNLKTIRELGG